MPVRLLLIHPKFAESFWSFKWALDEILPGKRALNPPLGLATVAALCPPDWEVTIVDENLEPVPLNPQSDIVGIGGMGVQFHRQQELLLYYRRKGYFTVAGGSYASLCPEQYEQLADSVISGEAEYIWPRFCRDYVDGKPLPLYRETGTVALADSPTPRFDLLQLEKYSSVALQFSRGCPFLCEFCDIIVMFGRKPRWKSNAQVGRELDALRARDVRNVFFVDDNLIGNKGAAKAFLRFLAEYQQQHAYRFRFGTEASLNLAQDPELLRLFPLANFTWLFIGIESSDPQTLRETRKTQNVHEDTLTSLRRIYAHGLDVLAGFIIGFDNDTLDTFEQQFQFIMQSGIQVAMIGLLTALPHTPLYERLQREGRLSEAMDHSDNTKPATNVIPSRMNYDDMVEAYMALHRRLMTDECIAARIASKLRYLTHPVYAGEYTPAQQVVLLAKLLGKGILPGGPARWYHFLRSIPWRHPKQLPPVIVDWIAALAMRDYAKRHFSPVPANEPRIADEIFAMIERKLRRYRLEGRLVVALKRSALHVPELSIDLSGWLGRRRFARVHDCIEQVLRHTRSRVNLRIEESHPWHPWQIPHLHRFLQRLTRHGNRIFLAIPISLRERMPIDWARFNLVLDDYS